MPNYQQLPEIENTPRQISPQSSKCAERCKVAVVIIIMVLAIYFAIIAVSNNWIFLFEEWADQHKLQASACLIILFIPAALLFVPVDLPLYLCAGFM